MAVFIGAINPKKGKNTLEQKAIKDFIDYFGYAPSNIKIENLRPPAKGQFIYADQYYARSVNGKTLQKIHGSAWRLDRD